MPLIFISHASADKPLVDSLFDLLQTGCDVRHRNILCTSVDGVGVHTGEKFVDWIQDKVQISDFIILVVTPNYFASKFCMAEMGAVWALEKKVFPIVVPNFPREVGIALLGRQIAIMNDAGLDELRDEIAKLFRNAGKNTPRWTTKKRAFLGALPKILAELPKPDMD